MLLSEEIVKCNDQLKEELKISKILKKGDPEIFSKAT
jgi:hypothetical protein